MIFLVLGLFSVGLVAELVRFCVWKKPPYIATTLLILSLLSGTVLASAWFYGQLHDALVYQEFLDWYLSGKPGYLGQETEIF